jgi:hypothetical protein
VAIDNYAIVHQGVSAHCITPAYSLLPLTYYGIFWISKAISTLVIDCLTISRREKVITACGCEPLRAGGNDNNECIFNDIVINYQCTDGFTDPKNNGQ